MKMHYDSRKPFRTLACLGLIVNSGWAQGTIRFGFENEPLETMPPYVQAIQFYIPPKVVYGFGRLDIPAFEGEKSLGAWGEFRLASPDGNLIESFSMQFYIQGPATRRLTFGAGGISGRIDLADQWQTLSGQFETSVETISIFAFVDEGQILPAYFAIDAVELQTVPEPCTLALLGLGALGCLATRLRR